MTLRYVISGLLTRCLTALFTLWLVSLVIFAALSLVKGDAASARLAGSGSVAQLAQLRSDLGLDRPLPQRYFSWLHSIIQGDWGNSYRNGRPVSQIILERGCYSLLLGASASVLLVPLALLLGIWSGLRPGSLTDRAIAFMSLAFLGLPEFVTGTLLVVLFALTLHWLPALSLMSPEQPWWQQLQLMVLPLLTMLSVCLAQNVRMIRMGVMAAADAPATESARLNGIGEGAVIVHWILPVALAGCLPVMARYITYLLGGALIAETLFAWPGLAVTLLNATLTRDTPVVMGIALVICSMTVLLNLLADLLTTMLNPAARQGGKHG